MRLEIPGLTEFFLEHADDAQLAHLPAATMAEAQEADGRIRIAAESDTPSMSRVDPAAAGGRTSGRATRSARPRGRSAGS